MKDTIIKVRGYHLDVYQHVNNARYLEFLEEARWNALEDGDLISTLQQNNWGFAVVNINIAFRRAAVLCDVLVIQPASTRLAIKVPHSARRLLTKPRKKW